MWFQKHRLSVVAAAGVILTSVSPIHAATTESSPLVVTASRFATTIDTAPVNTHVITADIIEKSGATNVSQVLERQAGLFIEDLFGITGAKATADLGGFGPAASQNTLVLLNGRRMNNVDLGGVNLASIPVESIERIEIIQGSSAVLYGDNAVGGVINIVTKNAFGEPVSRIQVQGGSFGTRRISGNYSGVHGDTAVYVSGENLDSDGYRDNSSIDNANASAELSRMTDTASYGARFNWSKEDFQLPGALNEPAYLVNPEQGKVPPDPSGQTQYSVEAFYLGDQYRAELAFRNKDSSAFNTTEADLDTLSFTPRFNRKVKNHRLIAGLDYYNSEMETRADFTNNFGTLNVSDLSQSSYGLYLTDAIGITPQTTINLGFRRHKNDLSVTNTNISTSTVSSDGRDDMLSAWDISLNHVYGNDIRTYLRRAKSFRFPVLDEIWSFFGGTITLLNPQSGYHTEGGIDMPLTDRTDFSLTVFRNDLTNEIGFDNIAFANVNFEPTRHDGVNMHINSKLKSWWTIDAGFAHRDTVFRSGNFAGKQVPQIPERKLTLSNQFDLGKRRHLAIDAIYIGQRYFGNDFSNVGKKLPAYTKLNLSYQQQWGPWKARLLVNNLTNKQTADTGFYSSFSANPYFYYPLPERAFVLGLAREFR
jgi:iron complex outermembrane receptor protein